MNEELELLNRLCKLYNLPKQSAYVDTYIDEVKFFKVTDNEKLAPLFYKKGFSFIAYGKKIAYVNDEEFVHGQTDYLIVCSPQAVQCETFILGEEPLIGIYITLNINRLNKVIKKFLEENSIQKPKDNSFSTVTCNIKTDVINNILFKILKALECKTESSILADGLLDELYLRILQSEKGYMLEQLTQQNSNLSKVSNVIEYIVNNLDEKIALEDMARKADMSVNNFHRLFKEAQNDTPVQFIKKIKLNKAKQLIVYDNKKAVEASQMVGYTSFSQFSREFKRHFGLSPSQIANSKE